jgi:hypothetical protein
MFYLDALGPGVQEVLFTYDFEAALRSAAGQVGACMCDVSVTCCCKCRHTKSTIVSPSVCM